jgi:Xaa-Pro aminopeptidase
MKGAKKFKLIEIDWPDFGPAEPPAPPPAAEFERRLDDARASMRRSKFSHLVVYGDREHFANLAYLTGFDPRFEEALLILREKAMPLLLVGNECIGHLPVSPLHEAGRMRHERFQSFSLVDQPRGESRSLREIFRSEGIRRGARVGAIGWKYFLPIEARDPEHTLDLPAYIADALRALAGKSNIVNAAALLIGAEAGLRTRCSPFEIAYLEYTNTLASDSVRRMIRGVRPGMVDREIIRRGEFNGEPFGAHPTIKTAATRHGSLMSPVGAKAQRGEPLSLSVCHWGSNCCRAGWLARTAADLPAEARDYVEAFAGPYFETMAAWLAELKIGATGDRLARVVAERLPFERFGVFLNPGHLIHLDEWVCSPFQRGSNIRLRSGMAIQTDIIPKSPVYFSSRMEDGVVLADAALRQRLRKEFPACSARCDARRNFMIEVLGFDLPAEVLPLSNLAGIVPPFLLRPDVVFALSS